MKQPKRRKLVASDLSGECWRLWVTPVDRLRLKNIADMAERIAGSGPSASVIVRAALCVFEQYIAKIGTQEVPQAAQGVLSFNGLALHKLLSDAKNGAL